MEQVADTSDPKPTDLPKEDNYEENKEEFKS